MTTTPLLAKRGLQTVIEGDASSLAIAMGSALDSANRTGFYSDLTIPGSEELGVVVGGNSVITAHANGVVDVDILKLAYAGSPTANGQITYDTGDSRFEFYQDGSVYTFSLDGLVPPTDNTTLDASTSAHGLLPKLSGQAGQYLAGDGNWYDLPLNASWFLTDTASDIGGYKELITSLPTGGSANASQSITGADILIEEWAASADDTPDFISAQVMHVHLHAAITNGPGVKDAYIYVKFYRRDSGGSETLLGTSDNSGLLTASDDAYNLSIAIDDEEFASTDRGVMKVYATATGSGSDPTVAIYYEGSYDSRIEAAAGGVGGGNVTGPASSTDNAICRFDGATGKVIQDSVVVVSDAGAMSGLTSLQTVNATVTGTLSITDDGTPLIIGSDIGGNTFATFNAAAGSARKFYFQTASVNRWTFGADSTAESGSDAGSDLGFTAFDDSGVKIDDPFVITRAAAGNVTITRTLSVPALTDCLTVNTATTSDFTIYRNSILAATISYAGASHAGISVYPDQDIRADFGRCSMGSIWASDRAYWAHYDNLTSLSFALQQTAAGYTTFNAASGQTLDFRINNAQQFYVDTTGLNSSSGKRIVPTDATGQWLGDSGGTKIWDVAARKIEFCTYVDTNAASPFYIKYDSVIQLTIGNKTATFTGDSTSTYEFAKDYDAELWAGRAYIGNTGGSFSDSAMFCHLDKTANPAIRQTTSAVVFDHGPGETTYFRSNAVTIMSYTASGFGDLYVQNNKALYWRNNADTGWITGIIIGTSDQLQIGNTATSVTIYVDPTDEVCAFTAGLIEAPSDTRIEVGVGADQQNKFGFTMIGNSGGGFSASAMFCHTSHTANPAVRQTSTGIPVFDHPSGSTSYFRSNTSTIFTYTSVGLAMASGKTIVGTIWDTGAAADGYWKYNGSTIQTLTATGINISGVVKPTQSGSPAANGEITYNTATAQFEFYENGAVVTLAGGSGVTASANITDNSIVRGDGGAKGVQESVWTISDTGLMSLDYSGAGSYAGNLLQVDDGVVNQDSIIYYASATNQTVFGIFHPLGGSSETVLQADTTIKFNISASSIITITSTKATIDGDIYFDTNNTGILMKGNVSGTDDNVLFYDATDWLHLGYDDSISGITVGLTDTTIYFDGPAILLKTGGEGGQLGFEGSVGYGNGLYLDRVGNDFRLVYNAVEHLRYLPATYELQGLRILNNNIGSGNFTIQYNSSDRFIINSSNTVHRTDLLYVVNESASLPQFRLYQYTTTNAAPYISFLKHRGTEASPADTASGDYLGIIAAYGAVDMGTSTSAEIQLCRIIFQQTGAWSGQNAESIIIFNVNTGAGLVEPCRINSGGLFISTGYTIEGQSDLVFERNTTTRLTLGDYISTFSRNGASTHSVLISNTNTSAGAQSVLSLTCGTYNWYMYVDYNGGGDTLRFYSTTATADIMYLATTGLVIGSSYTISGGLNIQNRTFGQIYAYGIHSSLTLTNGTWIKVDAFTADGEYYDCVVDQANNRIQLTRTGKYRVSWTVEFEDTDSAGKVLCEVYWNSVQRVSTRGEIEPDNSGNVWSYSRTGYIDVTSANQYVELYMYQNSGSDKDVYLEGLSLSIERVGDT